MKIAIQLNGRTIRGNEKQVMVVATELIERGHDVVVSCRAHSSVRRALQSLGVRTTGIRLGGDLDIWHALRFAWWLRRERPEALLLTSWARDLVAGWAARLARVPRVVLRIGGVHRVSGARSWSHRLALTRYVDAIIVNSSAVAEHFRQAVPGIAEVVLVPNGIHVVTANAARLREELGIAHGATIVSAVGGLDRRKGFDLLIEAWASLPAEDVHLVIAGEGAERDRLQSQADELGVKDRIHLAGQRSDIPAFLAAADVFVLSSRSEGMSVALLEAMAAGKPVIATDVGGTWEALAAREGREAAGWIVPVGDARALEETLAQVLSDLRTGSADAARRAAEAKWRVHNWFTVDRMMDEVEAVLLAGR